MVLWSFLARWRNSWMISNLNKSWGAAIWYQFGGCGVIHSHGCSSSSPKPSLKLTSISYSQLKVNVWKLNLSFLGWAMLKIAMFLGHLGTIVDYSMFSWPRKRVIGWHEQPQPPSFYRGTTRIPRYSESSEYKINGQLGVPLTVHPWYILFSTLGFLGIIPHIYQLCRAYIGISHRSTLVGVHPTIPWQKENPHKNDRGCHISNYKQLNVKACEFADNSPRKIWKD